MIFQFMGGILVAAGVFASLLWSFYQTAMTRGRLQWAHGMAAAFTLAGMASLSFVSPILAMVFGVALAIAAIAALLYEQRWNRLLPLFQVVFAIVLILGLPFS